MKQKLWPILAFLLLTLLFVTACGELEFGIETKVSSGRPDVTAVAVITQTIPENMVLVTVTPIPEASDTPTAALSPTATPLESDADEAEAAPTKTTTPVLTQTSAATVTPPRATPRPVLPTATPWQPRIFSFSTSPTEVTPGGIVTADWTADGQSASLCLRMGGGAVIRCWDVSVSGTQNVVIEDFYREDLLLDLTVSTPDGLEAIASIFLPLACPDDWWFFEDPPNNCPQDRPQISDAAAQYFENGWMLWIEEYDAIYVFFEGSGQTFTTFFDIASDGDTDDDDDEYQPPEGRYVPVSGFGLVWRREEWVRERLGWALAPEFGFDTTYQWESGLNYGRLYLLDPEERIAVLNFNAQTWSYR